MFKKLVVLSRCLPKAAVVVLMVGMALGSVFLLFWASHATIQLAARHGHSWVGWVVVMFFWLILLAAGMGESKDEKGKEGNN